MDLGANLLLEFLWKCLSLRTLTLGGACSMNVLFSAPIVRGVTNDRSTHAFPGRFVAWPNHLTRPMLKTMATG